MLKQITLLTNICFEPYWRKFIKERFFSFQNDIQIKSVLYEEYQENVDSIKFADIIVICLNFCTFYANLSNDISSGNITYEDIERDCVNKCRDLYSYVNSKSKAHVIWFGFEDYYFLQTKTHGALFPFDGVVDKINLVLNDMLKEETFIDLKRLIAIVGLKNAYNTKGLYRWNAPYSKALIDLMVGEVYKHHLIATGNTKKCLVLDCDNVLWGGILSEDGIENIKLSGSGLGKAYQDFQRFILSLYYHGIILAICSKNDLLDVMTIFNQHSGMVIKKEHIACFQVNWNNKPDNIKMIANTLNIGLDSIVFVDDSPTEIEAIKSILPEVTTILFNYDTVYEQLACFNLKNNFNMTEINNRNKTYQTNRFREELKSKYQEYSEYIKALDIKIDIHEAKLIECNRISEITQRTNKCTNGKRYGVTEIKECVLSNSIDVYAVSVSDRFSDLGIVGVFAVESDMITLFSLSCRALGRDVEKEILNYIKAKYQINKVNYQSTGKNEALKRLILEIFPDIFLLNN